MQTKKMLVLYVDQQARERAGAVSALLRGAAAELEELVIEDCDAVLDKLSSDAVPVVLK